jgi:hypothetical protein
MVDFCQRLRDVFAIGPVSRLQFLTGVKIGKAEGTSAGSIYRRQRRRWKEDAERTQSQAQCGTPVNACTASPLIHGPS